MANRPSLTAPWRAISAPWTLALFPSDRWNRHGAAERQRQLAEIRVLADELAALGPGARRRLILASHTAGLRGELASLLGTAVLAAPMTQPSDGIAPRAPGPAGSALGRVRELGRGYFPPPPSASHRRLKASMRAWARA